LKRSLSLLLMLLFLCVSFTGCKEEQTNSTPDPADFDFVIDTQYVADLVSNYLVSDSYLSGVAAYESVMQKKNGGCLLEKALEYHQKDLNGLSSDAVLLQFRSDVCYGEGVISDCVLLYLDLNSGAVYDNITFHMDEIINSFSGDIRTEDEMHAVLMNVLHGYEDPSSVFWSSQGVSKSLTADEIAAVNDMLCLSYRGYESAEEVNNSIDMETGNPIITTDNEERVQKVIEMAQAFQQSPIYQTIANDPTAIRLSAAMEYKNDSFASGYPVHILMIHTDDFDIEMYGLLSGTMLMDLSNGALYTASDFDFNNMPDIHAFTSVEDAYPWCISCYDHILEGRETQLWASIGETIVSLTEEELALVNDTLGSSYAAAAQEKEVLQLKAAETLSDLQRTAFDAAMAFSKTARYQEAAIHPSSIQLSAASELTFVHPDNGFELHALLLAADGIDTDRYGFSAGIFIKDLKTGEGFTDTFMDLSDWTWDWKDYSDSNDVYAACLNGYENIIHEESFLFMEEHESYRHLSEADLKAVNAALEP